MTGSVDAGISVPSAPALREWFTPASLAHLKPTGSRAPAIRLPLKFLGGRLIMGSMVNWLGAVLLVVGFMGAPMAADTQVADPAIWGPYARLVGTTWRSDETGAATWQWGPDNTIVETCDHCERTVIRPGANPGELVSVYGSDFHTFDGRIGADGSVLWIRRGMVKMPSRLSIVDGHVVQETVKLDKSNAVARVTRTYRFDQTSGVPVAAPASAIAATATPAAPTSTGQTAVPGPPSIPPSAPSSYQGFRSLEPFVGKRLLSSESHRYLELQHGADGTLVIQYYNFDGTPYGRYVLAESKEQPGRLQMLETPYYRDDFNLKAEWTADGSLALSSTGKGRGDWVTNILLRADNDRIASRSRSFRVGPIAGESDTTENYMAPTSASIASGQAAQAAYAAQLAAFESAAASSCTGSAVAGTNGLLGVGDDGEYCALDGDWGREEDQVWSRLGLDDAPQKAEYMPTKALYDALVEANAAADAHLQQTQAAYDATMEQARGQAAYERAQAAQADTAMDAEERRRQLANAQQATQRQYEIGRQFENRNQGQSRAVTSEIPGRDRNETVSTSTDANQCVSRPEIQLNATTTGNTAARIVNGCGEPVDVRICLMTNGKGWNCGATWSLAPQAGWSWSSYNATGEVFMDARVAGSKRALAHP